LSLIHDSVFSKPPRISHWYFANCYFSQQDFRIAVTCGPTPIRCSDGGSYIKYVCDEQISVVIVMSQGKVKLQLSVTGYAL